MINFQEIIVFSPFLSFSIILSCGTDSLRSWSDYERTDDEDPIMTPPEGAISLWGLLIFSFQYQSKTPI